MYCNIRCRLGIRKRRSTVSSEKSGHTDISERSDGLEDEAGEDEVGDELDEAEKSDEIPPIDLARAPSTPRSDHGGSGSHVSQEGLLLGLPPSVYRRETSRRDYTSITDKLEVLVPEHALGHTTEEVTPPAVKMEADMLQVILLTSTHNHLYARMPRTMITTLLRT